MKDEAQTKGRKENGAQPLGQRQGLVSEAQTKRTAEAELKSAGPDGGDARAIGDTFKKAPGKAR